MKHLNDVKMTYWQHMVYAGGFAFQLGLAVIVLLIHAVIPCLFERTGSGIINKVYERMNHGSSSTEVQHEV